MQICGLQKTTLLDYPEKVAATIFLKGCNFRCSYCHNMNIAEGAQELPFISTEELFGFLNKRKGILDGVCITGGEPTINKELPEFIKEIKKLGFLVKLDTNGTDPSMLKQLIENELIDYAAMDIKSSLNGYAQVTGSAAFKPDKIKESIDILLNGDMSYELRTTVVKEYHDTEVFEEIGQMIRGCKNYYLQAFRDSQYVKDHSLSSYNKEELLAIAKQLEKYDIKAYVRGI